MNEAGIRHLFSFIACVNHHHYADARRFPGARLLAFLDRGGGKGTFIYRYGVYFIVTNEGSGTATDFKDDAKVWPVKAPVFSNGLIHAGFIDALHRTVTPICSPISQLYTEHGGVMVIGGNSLGGAISWIMASLLDQELGCNPLVLTTGCPSFILNPPNVQTIQGINVYMRLGSATDILLDLPPLYKRLGRTATINPMVGGIFQRMMVSMLARLGTETRLLSVLMHQGAAYAWIDWDSTILTYV